MSKIGGRPRIIMNNRFIVTLIGSIIFMYQQLRLFTIERNATRKNWKREQSNHCCRIGLKYGVAKNVFIVLNIVNKHVNIWNVIGLPGRGFQKDE